MYFEYFNILIAAQSSSRASMSTRVMPLTPAMGRKCDGVHTADGARNVGYPLLIARFESPVTPNGRRAHGPSGE